MKTKIKKNNNNKLAINMAIALILGLIVGTGFLVLRENLITNGNASLWNTINKILFQDISVEGANDAIGIFYILGQLFVNSLQLVIVPMVFTSIALAMCRITDTKKLGRISYKTILGFLSTSVFALVLAGIFGMTAHKLGFFNVSIENIASQIGSTGGNPLLVFVQTIPNNITSVFTQNGRILSIVFLVFGYALFILVAARLNPVIFVKKISKVALFGFSTSSSASSLPLNTKITVEELGVSEEIASFTLPLGMTINMNGTAIMQVIAAIFIASSAGYDITIGNIAIISLLALIASIGTPAAPGAGAIILFTVLTGMGYQNDAALLAYSLILAINRPVEMLVTSLNVVGDAATAVVVAKSENALDERIYNNEDSTLQKAS